MDWITGLQRAINYIEDHILEPLDYGTIADQAYISSFHFQRIFSMLCGYTIGEYIRNRRLSMAGVELSLSDSKIIDVALKYGYTTPESFTKAFSRFHGITPKVAREPGAPLKSFERLSIKISLEGGEIMNYRIEKKSCLSFVGYKDTFSGELAHRFDQEKDFWMNTRDKQHILSKMQNDPFVWYDINTNFADDTYDHYIAVQSTQEAPIGFDKITIPELTYAIFETEKMKFPTHVHLDLRRKIISEWLPSSNYILAEGPEITCTHWFKKPDTEQRYIEIWLPVEKKH